jgi:hypothetical protein
VIGVRRCSRYARRQSRAPLPEPATHQSSSGGDASGGRRRDNLPELVRHALFAFAHDLGVDAWKAALLGRVNPSRAAGGDQPAAG